MTEPAQTPNPLLTPSELPYQLPPFAEISVEHYRPAIEQGMAEQRAEVHAITADPEPAGFANTLEALERSGTLLRRATAVFSNHVSSDGDADLRALSEQLQPLLSEHQDAILLDRVLVARVDAVHAELDRLDLDDEQRELVRRWHRDMTEAGAGLDETAQQRLREINSRLARLSSQFQQRVVAGMKDGAVLVADAAELDGLDDGALATAARAAEAAGHPGGWLITCTNYTNHPWLARLHSRPLRQRLFEAQTGRGGPGPHDTEPLVLELVRLRAERASVLGFADHASVVTAAGTAQTPQAVRDRFDPMARAAAANVAAEKQALQQEVDEHCRESGAEPFELAPWDWSYYTERLRQRRFALDLDALRPWFEAERVLTEGVFAAATLVYGLTFTERPDLPGYREDVRVFEVHDADGTGLGLYLLDLHTRDTKNGGAWMNSLVLQNRLHDQRPVVVNNLNVNPPVPGEPTLLTLSEVTTFFHEFGHALHGLLSAVGYPRFSGTRVPRDFVEFPSQVNEMWIQHPDVLARYARHVETGEPLPAEQLERLRAAATFNQGFLTAENLASALLDQEWHALPAGAEISSVDEFEAAALRRIGLDEECVPPRYHSRYFAHVFANSYDARYYSYLWSEVLDADTVAWFEEHGGLSRGNGDHFRRELLSRGSSRDPMDSYRAFRGRDPEQGPLLARRGLG